MSNYNLQVTWSGKDALSDSDPDKVISGDDFHTEFTAVKTAVNTKAEINGSATETFSAVTAASGTNTTQVATTAFVTSAINLVYPVGAIFTTVTAYANSAAVVAAIGGTTWVSFAAGKMLVGVDTGDADFDTVEETGGSKDTALTAHEHFIIKDDGSSGAGGGYTTTVDSTNTLDTVAWAADSDTSYALKGVAGQVADRGLTSETGTGDGVGGNLQPYITVYMWKRTA